MGWNEQLRAQHLNNNCLDRLVFRTCSVKIVTGRNLAVQQRSLFQQASCAFCLRRGSCISVVETYSNQGSLSSNGCLCVTQPPSKAATGNSFLAIVTEYCESVVCYPLVLEVMAPAVHP